MLLLNKIFGNPNSRYITALHPLVERIGNWEPQFEKLSADQIKERSLGLKKRVAGGEKLDDILPEAFALVREAARRTLSQRHFDVQLIGGIVLHQGKIAEMKTGEGKTLVATLPAYLNALLGQGVHIVTVNDYLAKRDAVWMGQIYYALGISVGCVIHEQSFLYDPLVQAEEDQERDEKGGFKVVKSYLKPVSKREAYGADITYGTNNEFGFDYLRDNMVYDLKEKVGRGFNFVIVDEVDSILIDESRTPLIISAPAEDSSEKYRQFAKIISSFEPDEDYTIDEKRRVVFFTDKGQHKAAARLNFDPWGEGNIITVHQLEEALKAIALFKRDRDYVVKDGQVIIVDQFTGRLLPGRRYSSGLHQALEAKEGVKVQPESRTLGTVTFQNYFRMYKKLAGMTGTALTSAEEFDKVYKLEVVPIPTNKSMLRKDLADRIYKTTAGKYQSVINEIRERHGKGQPILVGTVSIGQNELLAQLLSKEGISHEILNAKNHEQEGQIIAQAGRFGAVTIATNMAGRGVDIILGGNPSDPQGAEKVRLAGGLHVIGTERHEARRIDNQLRGRAGRQGDPGSSQFFLSLEDDLMRIFGGERIKSMMGLLRISEDQPIEAKMLSRAVEGAQSKIEGFNFDARKHVLEYDDVMNKHRDVFYKKRREILDLEQRGELREKILDMVKNAGHSEEEYLQKETELGKEKVKEVERFVSLRVMDMLWVEHLEGMEHLRDSVNLRAYGHQDPLVEYKKDGHHFFNQLLEKIETGIVDTILGAKIDVKQNKLAPVVSSPQSEYKKVGRNDSCPCGSGKKFKKCHGK